ncbi:MAG: hypothetical protein IJ737_06940 [Ruminococcus sp.]|nr:hypothetical protein [Ruminococcus sp.]
MKPKFKVGDRVRILDGSKIPHYVCTWNDKEMPKYVGSIQTIRAASAHGYKMKDIPFFWDERGLELVEDQQKIVITTDGKTTKAVLYVGKYKIDQAAAKCSPDDTFSFMAGAKLALARLETVSKPAEKDRYKAFFNAFKTGTIAISVKHEDWDCFLGLCDDFDIRWASGDSTRTYRPLDMNPSRSSETFRVSADEDGGLMFNVHMPEKYLNVDFKRR